MLNLLNKYQKLYEKHKTQVKKKKKLNIQKKKKKKVPPVEVKYEI
jgi:hypothetical protein